jgi:hypothetical protein
MIDSSEDLKDFFDRELHRSRAPSAQSWGRKAILAVDNDDVEQLAMIFKDKSNAANINEQTTTLGYAGYLWTMKIHQYLGDTILHLAVKMRKIKAVYILLLYGADVTIKNVNNIACETLIKEVFGKSASWMLLHAHDELIESINPFKCHLIFPETDECISILNEAERLMRSGRMLSSELPKTFHYHDLKQKRTKVIKPTKPIWRRRCDFAFGADPYLLNTVTGEKKAMTAYEIKYGYWDAVPASDGKIYYINEVSSTICLL